MAEDIREQNEIKASLGKASTNLNNEFVQEENSDTTAATSFVGDEDPKYDERHAADEPEPLQIPNKEEEKVNEIPKDERKKKKDGFWKSFFGKDKPKKSD